MTEFLRTDHNTIIMSKRASIPLAIRSDVYGTGQCHSPAQGLSPDDVRGLGDLGPQSLDGFLVFVVQTHGASFST